MNPFSTRIASLEQKLLADAQYMREQAKLLPPGPVRDALLRKARQTETGSHAKAWADSSELQPPE